MSYASTWTLADLYPGGVTGAPFQNLLTTMATQIAELTTTIDQYDPAQDQPDFQQLGAITTAMQTLESHLQTANVYVNGLSAADYANPSYRPIEAKLAQLSAAYQAPHDAFSRRLTQITNDAFSDLQKQPQFVPIAFHLGELREQAQRLLDPTTEKLLNQLRLDGLQAWSSHYDTIAAGLTLTYQDETGADQTISAGQALNLIETYPDNTVRARIMAAYEAMWTEAEDLTADTLNHLAGQRLTEQQAHGITDPLQVPLELNRMTPETLATMWSVVEDAQGDLVPYLTEKARLLGKNQLDWQDQATPLTPADQDPVSFNDAAHFIIKHFATVSPKLADFAETAFRERWIEAEDRPNKQPGGWMDQLPDFKQPRIFMTFAGTPNDTATLAHELGHAFHSSQLNELPVWRGDYAMNVAETASTFAETVVANASVAEATTDAEKLMLLDSKLAMPVAMFMNINARYRFETAFYQERQAGYVPASRLNDLMTTAQQAAFGEQFGALHPHFWSSKLHFYIDDIPFYNFPYTFGYLFSLGIYAWAQTQPDFESAYIALLQDTANMTTEELAQKHLGVDLTQPDFWQAGVDLIKQDVADFVDLAVKG